MPASPYRPGVRFLEDLDSKNGTDHNGERVIKPVRLSQGDQIRLGAVQATFMVAPDSTATDTITGGRA